MNQEQVSPDQNQSNQPTGTKKTSSTLFVILGIVIVGALGYFLYSYTTQPEEEVIVITPPEKPTISPTATSPSPTATADDDEMADWKTYTDTKYGFNFKYPNKYELINKSPSEDHILFESSEKTGTGVNKISMYKLEIKISSTSKSLEDLAKTWLKGDILNSEMTDTKVSEQNAKEVINSDTALGAGKYSACLMVYKNNKYEITAYNNSSDESFTKTDFEKILSTFKFTK